MTGPDRFASRSAEFYLSERQAMNRKQRRASGHSGAGSALGLSAGSAPGAKAARMFEAAVAHHRAGALAKAERQYREILELFPSHAEAQSRIGAVLMAQGKTTEAIHHLERAIALKPDLFEALGNLAQAYLAAGRNSQAAIAALRALELRETAPGRTLFAHCARYARFTADKNGRVRKLMVRALAEGWAPPRALTGVCLSLIKLNGAVNDGVGQVDAAWPARLPPAELFGRPAMAEVYRDPLLCCLLTFDPITDMGFERLLGSVRHAMLTLCTTKEEWDERLLDFFCAVARQCFINEYVYSLTEAEAVRARELKAALVEKIQTGEPVPALWPVTVAAYFPLHSLPGIESLCDRAMAGLHREAAHSANQGTGAGTRDREDDPGADRHRRRGIAGGPPAIRGDSLSAMGQDSTAGKNT